MVTAMLDANVIFIAAVFAFAGFVKGVIGLGLPTVAMGLLALAMPPVEAAAILLLPSFLTNAWQMMAGPSLRQVVLRLWPMMIAVCIATWAGIGLMTAHARYGAALLGIALSAYALFGLSGRRLTLLPGQERTLGPLAGALTGLITSATGVFVIPAVPYLQAIGFEKEDLVQALGLSFTVSTIALAVNIAAAGALAVSTAWPTLIALALAVVGMMVGQVVRLKLPQATFRRCFFVGLLLLGIHLVVRALA